MIAPNFRRRKLVALVVFIALFAVHLSHMILNVSGRGYAIGSGTYEFTRGLEPHWTIAELAEITHTHFAKYYPRFRPHPAVVNVAYGKVRITVLAERPAVNVAAFEIVGAELNGIVRQRQNLQGSDNAMKFVGLEISAYPWIKPLDVLAFVILTGVIMYIWSWPPREGILTSVHSTSEYGQSEN